MDPTLRGLVHRRRFLLGTLAAVPAVALLAKDDNSSRPGEIAPGGLPARVSALEQEVRDLEQQIADLRCENSLRDFFAPLANGRL